MTKQTTFHFITLGCPKNAIDSSSMIQLLERDGYQFISTPKKADVIIVNTCGFIESAREESYNVLHKLARSKQSDQLLIAAGCLTERYGAEVAKRIPGVDGILGTRHWMEITGTVRNLRKNISKNPAIELVPQNPVSYLCGLDENHEPLRISMAGSSTYLKIADGCRRPCAFCGIPLIKGTLVSRPMSSILEEAEIIQEKGARELILVAQDTTDYGSDLGMKDGLAQLLEMLAKKLHDLDWIRTMYAYPGFITDHLIDVMASFPQILPYVDIPLQHAHPATLQRMRRPSNVGRVRKMFQKIRSKLPGVSIRTTFIVGYPGETEEEFQTLLDFVEEMRFDRVGAFKFSFEPGTFSESLGDPIPPSLKEERYQKLMESQQTISLQINQSFVGKTLDVLVEGYNHGISVGRSYRDAPEIDGLVLVEGKLTPGKIVPVRITGAMVYDLTGIPA